MLEGVEDNVYEVVDMRKVKLMERVKVVDLLKYDIYDVV